MRCHFGKYFTKIKVEPSTAIAKTESKYGKIVT